MGRETECIVYRGDRSATAKVLLETNEMIIRGELRMTISFTEIREVTVDSGTLAVTMPDEIISLELGPIADIWAARMRNPRTLIDKLGLKPGHRVWIIDVEDAEFRRQLEARGIIPTIETRDLDAIIFGIAVLSDLDRLSALRATIRPNGMIWVVSPKGRPDLRDIDIYATAKAHGLVDTKVAAFSKVLTANKLVIPVVQRGDVR